MNDVTASKFLSLVLRHKPETIGMSLDPEGWLEIDRLIENANSHGTDLTLAQLHHLVESSDKRRFRLSNDGLRIRANQGHSVLNVDLKLSPVTPPDILFHGTVAAFIDSIRSKGLSKRSRNHVHLSAETETARNVGARRGDPIVLEIAAEKMHNSSHLFFLSENGVWLTEAVPVDFITFPANTSR